MGLTLLFDIGSTYTKAIVVDLDKIELKAQAKALTTVQDDVTIGIKKVLDNLVDQGIDLNDVEHRLACSSAAGGLKMIAVGLVPELTAEAAKRAALGAGAKVANVYSYELTANELDEIIIEEPDIILLAGGTDGGNKDVILHNAKVFAESKLSTPIVIAGNKVAAQKAENILVDGQKEVYVTANVMPKLEELNIKPAREIIRKIFLDKIIHAKGLSKAKEYINQVIMPTPSAVMNAAKLIAEGTDNEEGLGELLIVDIGGATTDIHSIAKGTPTKSGVKVKGLVEPYVKRTVEGDLGMRYSAPALLELVRNKEILSYLSEGVTEDDLEEYINKVRKNVEYIPQNELEEKIDSAIAKIATKLAVQRHVGQIQTTYTPFGTEYIQYGKDLTDLNLIIGTGGVLVHSKAPNTILKEGLFTETDPTILAPMEPKLMLDDKYILAAIGLLMEISKSKAVRLAKKHLKKLN
ncbi:methylaspartate mutase accessory protein GlmL [Selenihalanaerobacter shriftii]|uniref:MutL protein n=1 Tax=Selenihalanaerobacter shriftii TaxID=142842 RepID=A0A1T4MPS4_9FIRM|nr:methylaspartate mutase accessory protein GlmL [Selenihalanaerobacter shriftii]SJZ68774.1 conserved hypothetical protein [Selenihalanaerobacter shriftii]